MSSHPGCTLENAVELAEFLRDMHMIPEQVQDFIPTPGSLSTAIFYTGIHPLTGKPIYVPRKGHDKAMQRALMQYKNPDNYALVREALIKTRRQDLIGFGPHCLIPPRPLGQSRKKQDLRNKSVRPRGKVNRSGKNSHTRAVYMPKKK